MKKWKIVTWAVFFLFPVMYGELREWYFFFLFRMSMPDGKNVTWPRQEHESQISERASRLVLAGNRISSFLHQLLLLREVRILSTAAHPSPLHLLPLCTSTKIVSSGLSEVNLTLLFPLNCLICPAPNIRALPSRITSRCAVTRSRVPLSLPTLNPSILHAPAP